jgi:hypothetical protein
MFCARSTPLKASASPHPPAAISADLAISLLLQGITGRWGALTGRAVRDGVGVAAVAVGLALVPWNVVQVILRELVAGRPVLIALYTRCTQIKMSGATCCY